MKHSNQTLTDLGSTLTSSKLESSVNVICARNASSLVFVKFIQKLILDTKPAVSEEVVAPVEVLKKNEYFSLPFLLLFSFYLLKS